MIADITKVQEAIIQALREINDACLQMRGEGVTCLLPEFVDFEVQMVTNSDINAVTRTVTEADDDGGTSTTTRAQGNSIDTTTSSGEHMQVTRTNSEGQSEDTIVHPTQQTAAGGGDSSTETQTNTYVAA